MGIKTKIQYCDSTVNPTPCCTGCELYPQLCYAAAMHARYDGHNSGWPTAFTEPSFFSGRIEEAAKWSDLRGKKRPGKPWLDGRPRMIFVDDLGDPFAPLDDPRWEPQYHWLLPHLDTIAKSPHIWLLLTKWPKRFAEFTKASGPLPCNIWGGTSVTSQANAGRIEHLCQIDLSVRFISYEPALGPVDFSPWLFCDKEIDGKTCRDDRWPGRGAFPDPLSNAAGGTPWSECGCSRLRWIIAGGASGPHAPPSYPDWFRQARDQCAAAGVRYFFKGWGDWGPDWEGAMTCVLCGRTKFDAACSPSIGDEDMKIDRCGHCGETEWKTADKPLETMRRVGKRAAGCLLDGREHHAVPEGQA